MEQKTASRKSVGETVRADSFFGQNAHGRSSQKCPRVSEGSKMRPRTGQNPIEKKDEKRLEKKEPAVVLLNVFGTQFALCAGPAGGGGG